ncbi:hypothetical protein BJ912DRAFT_929127 [Pholiota molesta]|nr:hypothetical protein BJ912DRAFT_929127 [Pholiota molesta]
MRGRDHETKAAAQLPPSTDTPLDERLSAYENWESRAYATYDDYLLARGNHAVARNQSLPPPSMYLTHFRHSQFWKFPNGTSHWPIHVRTLIVLSLLSAALLSSYLLRHRTQSSKAYERLSIAHRHRVNYDRRIKLQVLYRCPEIYAARAESSTFAFDVVLLSLDYG